MQLAQTCFNAKTKAYVLGIRGYEFNNFDEELTTKAKENLAAAIAFIEERLQDGRFDDAVTVKTPNADQ